MSECASAWAKLRRARFLHDGYTCQRCPTVGTDDNLEAHYVVGDQKDFRYRDVSDVTVYDLITLCCGCFLKTQMPHESPAALREVERIKGASP